MHHKRVNPLLALGLAVAVSACGGEADDGSAAASPDSVPQMVTGTTGAPGPGTVGTPGTPGATQPDSMAGPDTTRAH